MGTAGKTSLQIKHGSAPDEVRPFIDHGRVELHRLGQSVVLKAIFEPGWKWSEHVGPIAGTRSCQAAHRAYVMSGRMQIVTDDGVEAVVGPGDFFELKPGHDAWVLGDERCVMVDFGGFEAYASRGTEAVRGEPSTRAAIPASPH